MKWYLSEIFRNIANLIGYPLKKTIEQHIDRANDL